MAADLILLLIILFCVLSGYRKGLLMSLCTLLVLVLACLGAAAAREALTPRVSEWMEPRLAEYISSEMQEYARESAGEAAKQAEDSGLEIGGNQVDLSGIVGFLDNMGIDLQQAAEDAAEQYAAPLANTAAEAAARVLVETMAGGVIFCLSFLVIYLVLHSVLLVVNLADHLPVVHSLNHAGGALVGLMTGAFFLTMAMALLTRYGGIAGEMFQGPVAKLIQSIAGVLIRK